MRHAPLLVILAAVLPVLAAGCGGTSAPAGMTTAAYQPIPRDNAYYAQKAGWTQKKPEKEKDDLKDRPQPEVDDPDPGPSEPVDRGPDFVVTPDRPDPDPRPMFPDPDPRPMDPDPMPVTRTIPPPNVRLPPTPANLYGTWRGETQSYVVEKEKWRDDGAEFYAKYFESADDEGNPITAIQISQEINGSLTPVAPPSPVEVDLDAQSVRFLAGIAPVSVRIVEDGLMEVRGVENNFTVIRYFTRIAGTGPERVGP